MVGDDDLALRLLDEVRALREERELLAAQLAASAPEPAIGTDDPEALADAFAGFLRELEGALDGPTLAAREDCVRTCLGTPAGAAGPITLYFRHRKVGEGRYRGELVGGVLGIIPPVAQAFYRKVGGGSPFRNM